MSVSIRHRYHGGNVLINTEKVINGNSVAITGNTIPALLRNGTYRYRPFGGVVDEEAMTKDDIRLKIVNVTALWWNDIGFGDDCYRIPANHYIKGYLINEKYYIAIKDDKPLHWEVTLPVKNYHTDNVVSIRPEGKHDA